MKFNYATKLNPTAENKNGNRVSLIGDQLMLVTINGRRTFVSIDVAQLPFTDHIRKAYEAVITDSELEYFNIGKKPTEQFELTDVDLLHINYMMFLFVMRRAAARHVWNKTQPNYFTSYVREDIMSSMYIHRLKMVTLQAVTQGWSPRSHMAQITELYIAAGFPAHTARLYMLYWNSGEALQTVQGLNSVNEPFVLDFDALLDEADITIMESNIQSLASYEAHRRLGFVASSNRYDPSDFATELLNRSRLVYVQCRPFLTRQHSINYARSVISSYALRMLQHYQSPDRARMLTNPDGSFDNRFASLDSNELMLTSDGSIEDQLIEAIDYRREQNGGW